MRRRRTRTPKKRAKAQAEHIFLYVATIVVVGIVLLFGYKAIMTVKNTGDQAAFLNLKHSFQEEIDRHSTFGRIGTIDFSIPQEVVKVCFVDAAQYCSSPPCPSSSDLEAQSALLADAVASNSRSEAEKGKVENVFLFRDDGIMEGVAADPLTVQNGILCSTVQGKLSLRLSGLGKTTKVETAS